MTKNLFAFIKCCKEISNILFPDSEVVPLFEGDKEDEFEDVYDENKIITSSGSSGRLASLWGAESPGEDFVMIKEAEQTSEQSNNARYGNIDHVINNNKE